MSVKENYYLGLDIGTNSIGWAVTDHQYNLIKYKRKDLWGIRLFESAKQASDRRLFRTNRRRNDRVKQRIDLLQELFDEEISKIDPTFFIRLNESRLIKQDKTIQTDYPLFITRDYSDKDYHRQYPTIYHLRSELIHDESEHDIRLVYLAIHHILKNRGHFLIDGSLEEAKAFEPLLNNFIEVLQSELDLTIQIDDTVNFRCILSDKDTAASRRASALAKLITIVEYPEDFDSKSEQKRILEICKLLVGNKGTIKTIFSENLDLDIASFSFASSDYEEKIYPQLETSDPSKCFVLEVFKSLRDWSVLSAILGTNTYFSDAKIEQYNVHHKNLRRLKHFMKKYISAEDYKEYFNSADGKDNYSNYIGSLNLKTSSEKFYKTVKSCTEEEFYKALKGKLSKITCTEEDESEKEFLITGAENKDLLPLQRSKDNSVVPHQIHEQELKAILNNAQNYLTFLKETDEDGLSISDKILSILNFRIPYYVGPLSDRHKEQGSNTWIVRREEGRITPWNYSRIIDLEQSNEAFIRRMTNKCTYLIGEDVLPKNSLLYSEYMVRNELSNLRINGHKLSPTLKEQIFDGYYKTHNRVSVKSLCQFLKTDDPELTSDNIEGYAGDLKASLSSYLDFSKKIFGEAIEEYENRCIAEDIIRWSTIYGNDSRMLENVIRRHYGNQLTDDQIKAASRLHYSGWGNFSEKFLNGIKGRSAETDEQTIIQALCSTECNLMQLLSKEFNFKEIIDEYNAAKAGSLTKVSYEEVFKDLYVSPAVKRPVWQTIQITDEITKVMGYAPEKIFIEMARENETEDKKKRNAKQRDSRKQRLLELYQACKEDARLWSMLDQNKDWISEIENKDERDFNSTKLYLYYSQLGRCMYSGEYIDLDELMRSNSKWDRDHIYPQSKIMDDSLDNLVLVSKVINGKKSNDLLREDIRTKMTPFWQMLREKGLISKEKYYRLTRTADFSEDELAGFINRQLVETRQATKAVADLFTRMYKDSKVVYVKAGLVSRFRDREIHCYKSRMLNDLHHAKDAYLNIVVGNVYNTRFTDNPIKWIRQHANDDYSLNAVFYWDVIDTNGEYAWEKPDKTVVDGKAQFIRDENHAICGGSADVVKETMLKDRMFYTEYTYCATGGLFNATIKSKDDDAITVALKKELDPSNYGGYYSANTSYFAMIEFTDKGKRSKRIIGVPIYIDNMLKHNPDAFLEYCASNGYKDVKILHSKIKKNSLISVNGYPLRIRGENAICNTFKNNIQFTGDVEHSDVIRKIEQYKSKERSTVNEQLDGLNESTLLDLYEYFIKKLQDTYKKRPANISEHLIDGSETFKQLSLTEKTLLLANIMQTFKCDIDTISNLESIKGPGNSGSIKVSKNTIGKSKLVLINQSVTGIFENRIEL